MKRANTFLIAITLMFAAWAPLQAAQVLKIPNPTPEAGDRFGFSIDGIFASPVFTAVGDTGNILVGTPSDGASERRGAAYLLDGNNGDLLQTYFSPSRNPGIFGRAATVLDEENFLIGGVDFNGGNGSPLTIARFYQIDAPTGNVLKTFIPPTSSEIVSWGSPLATTGNEILVGARNSSVAGPAQSGAAYLIDARTGNQLQQFLPPSPTFLQHFGGAIARTGDNVIVGANLGPSHPNEVHFFSATTGALQRTLSSPAAGRDDFFGSVVAADENNFLVGAPGDDTAGPNAGAAYLFEATTGNLLQTFLNPTPERLGFGNYVAIRGNRALTSTGGAAYLFDVTTGGLIDTFLNPTPEESNGFGAGVAFLDSTRVIIGAPNDDTGAEDAGAIYVFEIVPEPSSTALIILGIIAIFCHRQKQKPACKPRTS